MESLVLLHGYEVYDARDNRSLGQEALQGKRDRPGQGLRLGLFSLMLTLILLNLSVPAWAASLKRGDRGTAVREIQSALRTLGYNIRVDGVFGADTEAAIRRFQRVRRLKVDGIVGPATKRALRITQPASRPTSGANSVKIVTQGDRLNVRSGPGSQHPVLKQLSNGSSVAVSGRTTNGWLELADGGWIAGQFAAGGTGGPTLDVADVQEGPASRYVRVVTDGTGLNIRSGPGTAFSKLDQLPNGTMIATTGQRNQGWIQLSQGGWIAEQFTQADPGPTLPSSPAPTVVTPTVSTPTVVTPTGVRRPAGTPVRVVTAGNPLNVRSGPGMNFSIARVLNNGVIVRVSGNVSAGWVQLEDGGWVPTQFIR